jgi:uncharacterized protein with FMN-binding domain
MLSLMKIKPFLSKTLKAVHIALAAGVLGGFISTLVLAAAKLGLDPSALAGLDSGILRLFTWVITYFSFGLIITSCLYSLFFGWGIIRYGWIGFKWLVALLLFVLAWFWLGPSVSGLASISDAGFHITTMANRYRSLSGALIASSVTGIALMVVAVILSTLRPFARGRERESRIEKIATIFILAVMILGIAMLVMSEFMLERYRSMPIRDVSAAGLQDGRYSGQATIGSYTYKVEVTVAAGRIVGISSVEPRESIYAEYAEGAFAKIMREQNANVDAITGATTTSKALMKAVEDALVSGGAR